MDKNQCICCNVKSCVHHEKNDQCGLSEINVTNSGEIQTAHYCGNYEEWKFADNETLIAIDEKHNLC